MRCHSLRLPTFMLCEIWVLSRPHPHDLSHFYYRFITKHQYKTSFFQHWLYHSSHSFRKLESFWLFVIRHSHVVTFYLPFSFCRTLHGNEQPQCKACLSLCIRHMVSNNDQISLNYTALDVKETLSWWPPNTSNINSAKLVLKSSN